MLQAEEGHPIHGWTGQQPVRTLLLGNRHVGKSTLLQRCAERCLPGNAVRLEPGKPHMFAWTVMAPGQQAQVQIQLTDLALQMDAQEARTSTHEALSDLHRVLDQVDLVVVMFSSTDQASYAAVEQWIHLVRLGAGKKYIAGLLVNNKRDLSSEVVSYAQALRLATSYQMNYLHISAAQSADDVDTLMLRLASLGQKLLRYRCNLMLTDRPLCPAGCQLQSRHKHVFSEYHAEDPMGKVELHSDYEHDKDDDDDEEFQQHVQPCSRIQPYWLRVATTPHPVPNLDSYPHRQSSSSNSVNAPSQMQMLHYYPPPPVAKEDASTSTPPPQAGGGCSTFCTIS
jgi:hypothetical protein